MNGRGVSTWYTGRNYVLLSRIHNPAKTFLISHIIYFLVCPSGNSSHCVELFEEELSGIYW